MQEEEDVEQFEMEISVSNPEKMGDGMSAYVLYTITTRTTMPTFKSPETSVRRRFSDFLRLHNKMAERHLPKGRIVPPAPEKSVKGELEREREEESVLQCLCAGMTTLKFSKSEDSNAAFLERRQASLQRYLNRLARHPVLRKDSDFMEFLENPNEVEQDMYGGGGVGCGVCISSLVVHVQLPKATETTALSGAGFMRLVKNVGQSISKIASKKSETDSVRGY